MWGRYEGKNKYAIAVFAAIFFICMGDVALWGQDLPEGIVRMLEIKSEEGENDIESMMEMFYTLLSHPVDINAMTEADMEKMVVFSPFQIASLLDYRKEFGDIISLDELALIDGFGEVFVREISPFITFSIHGDIGTGTSNKKVRNHLTVRIKGDIHQNEDKYVGASVYTYERYRFNYSELISVGITFEKDIGEKSFADFVSAHFCVKEVRLGNKISMESLVAGDYSARLGQGLVLWNGFSLTGLSAPSSLYKRENHITPYTSSDEHNFFRGVGATLKIGGAWSLTALFSEKMIDARADSECYYSIIKDGLHRTSSSLDTKGTLKSNVVGINLSYGAKSWKIGATGALYKYDKKMSITPKAYNQYLLYDGWWGNFSVDWILYLRKMRWWGEVAVDIKGAIGAVSGIVCSFSSDTEVALLCRHYSKSYIATYSDGYSSTSLCNNETGAILSFRWDISKRFSLNCTSDYAYHPWQRYRIPSSSMTLKNKIEGEWTIDKSNTLYVRTQYQWKDYDFRHKTSLRIGHSFIGGKGVGVSSRLETVWCGSLGYLIFSEVNYKHPLGKWRGSLRATVFHIDRWESRIYCYQRDLPATFSIPSFYGRGISAYLFAGYKYRRWLDICLKCAYIHYLHGKGTNSLSLKMQLSISF